MDDRAWGDTSKHYLIGLGGRGISSLEAFGVWEDGVAPFCLPVPGRKDWTPETPDGKETIRTERKYGTQVLPRDKLVSLLHRHVVERYSNQIELVYKSQVRPVEFEYARLNKKSDGGDQEKDNVPKVLVETSPVNDDDNEDTKGAWKPILANLVVASDGSARTFANRMEEMDRGTENPFRVVRFEDDNVRVYKTLPFRLPEKSWSISSSPSTENEEDIFWNYAVQSDERRVIFDALPANDQGDYVGILLLRGDDEMAQPNVDPDVFRAFLEQEIPQFISLLGNEAISAAAKSGPSYLPQFRYITPRMHQGQRTVLLGDTAHTVKPYFGMGANSALEDVKVRFQIDTRRLNCWKLSRVLLV
jgi:kynurenine 3-monooxygenase